MRSQPEKIFREKYLSAKIRVKTLSHYAGEDQLFHEEDVIRKSPEKRLYMMKKNFYKLLMKKKFADDYSK